MVDNDQYESVGVFVEKCDLENHPLICQPTVSVDLVDGRTGQSLIETKNSDEKCSIPVTKPFYAFQKRSQSPCWNEMLICNHAFKDICNVKNSHYLVLFEVCDHVQDPSSIFKSKQRDVIKVRVAWAFLKPVAADGTLNVNKELRLQLYKIGQKCSLPHHTCPVYHLYSDHKRKKFPGSLYVRVKGVVPSKPLVTLSTPDRSSSKDVPDVASPAEASSAAPKISVAEWSRLPTQSCKLPNNKYADVPVSRRGASCVAFSHSGMFLACGSFAKLVVFNVVERKETARLAGHSGLVYEVDWSWDDTLLLSVSADCSAMVWSMKPLTKTPLFVLPHPSFVYCGKWLRSGGRLVTGGKDSTMRLWENSEFGFELLEEIEGHHGFISAVETRGDSLMFSGDSLGEVVMWTLEEGNWAISRKFSLRETAGAVVDAIHLHPGQRRIVVTSRGRGSIMLDVAAGVAVHTYRETHLNARSVTCLSPCGSLLFSFSPCNIINVWEFDTGNLVATYNQVFPDIGLSQTELSGSITYHSLEHMAAFAVLGCNYPVVLLDFDYHNDRSARLGLTLNNIGKPLELEPRGTPLKPCEEKNERNFPSSTEEDKNSTEDKLAAIVRKIDRVLAVKREMTSHTSLRPSHSKEKPITD